MDWSSIDTWIVAAAILSACSCALLGNFLVLRRMSMMGDAISHAVLPGLAVAFMISGSRASLAMFIGAAIVGILTAVFTQWVNRFGRVDESAAMGVVFTSLFALGLILIRRHAHAVDIDPNCVLYGAIELVPLDTVQVGGYWIPRAALILSGVLVLNVLFVLMFFKELKISSFDEELATTLGINATFMHYLLMTLVAVTTVAAFESVGSILVIAMLIVPAATAHLLTDRLKPMILISLGVAVVSAVMGHIGAATLPGIWGFSDTNTSGMMAVIAGCLFGLAFFAAPRHGVISKVWHQHRLGLRVVGEDILGVLYRSEESGNQQGMKTVDLLREIVVAGRLYNRWALHILRREGRVQEASGSCRLTETGREEAVRLIRSHRLWETYFFEHTTLPADHVHAPAEKLEHITNDALRERLEKTAGGKKKDPHGRDIPTT